MIKKFIPYVLILITMLSFMSVPVYAASNSYASTLAFQGEHAGSKRTYNYDNMFYSATTSCSIGNKTVTKSSSYPSTYTVSLYRKTGWFTSEKVGSKTISRYGYSSIKWTNVGEGDYYFYFNKARDGVTVKSDNVCMKSYS